MTVLFCVVFGFILGAYWRQEHPAVPRPEESWAHQAARELAELDEETHPWSLRWIEWILLGGILALTWLSWSGD